MNTKNKLSKGSVTEFLIENGLIIVILALIAYIIISTPSFLSIQNFINILTQASTKLIIALGAGGLIVLAGTDLSAGRAIGMTALVSTMLLQVANGTTKYFPNLGEMPILVGLLGAVLVGAFIGAFNGFGVAKLKLHAFIATLGTQLILYGLIQIIVNAHPKGPTPLGDFLPGYLALANEGLTVFGYKIPWLIFFALIATLFMWFIWNKTELGKKMFAVGGNKEAAEVSGINVDRVIITVFLLSGIMYGIAGFLEGPRVGSVRIDLGTNYDLDAIAACVIGGVSFSGGVGKIRGIVLGVILLQVITYGLAYIGVHSAWQIVIKGALIIIAVALDTRKYLTKK